jgi:hypothetical protein
MDDKTSNDRRTEEGQLTWTSPDGVKHEFRMSSRVMYLDVVEVWQSNSLPYQEDGAEPKPLTRSIRGKAVMEDRSIQVIGEPETKSKTLVVTIGEMAPSDVQRYQSGELRAVSLSYNKSDWEIGNESEWWVQIYLPSPQIQPIRDAIESGKLTKLSLGLRLQNAYVTDYYAPISLSIDWYLNSGEYVADLASGSVFSLIVETKPFNLLSPIADVEQEPAHEDDASPVQTPPDVVSAEALTRLAAKADDLVKYSRRIFWTLVVIAFFTAVRGG